MEETRFASGAGSFYPQDPGELDLAVSEVLDPKAGDFKTDEEYKALIVPHSGYKHCGEVLGAGYNTIMDKEVDEVFIWSGSHFHMVEEVDFADFLRWETPFGEVETSHRLKQITHSDDSKYHDVLNIDNDMHDGEHAIEVHLPILQYMFGDTFRLLPFVMGEVSPRLVADALEDHIDIDDLLICSSELSKGYPKDYAEEVDQKSIEAILDLDTDKIMDETFQAFSKESIATLIEIAKRKEWTPELIKYKAIKKDGNRSSGQVAIGFKAA
jgi:hypothetical protein